MDKLTILKSVDHTILAQDATWSQVKEVLDDAILFQCASACISPCFVKQAKEYVKDKLKITTVIGFPSGASTTNTKVFETKEALENGADEIDMVIHIGWVKEQKLHLIIDEIKQIKEICGDKILKVIIETCFLNEEEKINLCKAVTSAGGDYIKTSTGFGSGGAKQEDVLLFRHHIGENIKIKAAGGIRTFEFANELIEAGANRIGASALVALMKQEELSH